MTLIIEQILKLKSDFDYKHSSIVRIAMNTQKPFSISLQIGKKLWLRVLIVAYFCFFCCVVECEEAFDEKQWAKQQKRKFKQEMTGISLSGGWQCANLESGSQVECFYEFFKIPAGGDIPINQNFYYTGDSLEYFDLFIGGYIEGFFWSKAGSSNNYRIDQLYLLVKADELSDSRAVELNIALPELQTFQIQQDSLGTTNFVLYQGKDIITTASLYDEGRQIVKFDISLQLQVKMLLETEFTFGEQQPNWKQEFEVSQISSVNPLKIRVESDSFAFDSELKRDNEEFYSLITVLKMCLVLQLGIVVWRNFIFQETPTKIRKIMFRTSEWFILHSFAFVFMISVLLIQSSLARFDTLRTLLYVGLINIGVGLFFIRKFEVVLQKFKNSKMTLKALIFCGLYAYFVWHFYDNGFFWLIETSLVLVWQVVHSMQTGGKGGLPHSAVLYVILNRGSFLFVLSSEENFFRVKPILSSQVILIGFSFCLFWILIQVQKIKGGRFMIPTEIIPGYFDYFQSENVHSEPMKEECSICVEPLNKLLIDSGPEQTESVELQSSSDITRANSSSVVSTNNISPMHPELIKFMRTPCGHNFHINCLTEWMQSKLVCPYCRSTLPQLNTVEQE